MLAVFDSLLDPVEWTAEESWCRVMKSRMGATGKEVDFDALTSIFCQKDWEKSLRITFRRSRSLYSEMQRRIVWWNATDVSQESAASICRVEEWRRVENHIPQKRLQHSASLLDVKSQSTVMFTVTIVRISSLAHSEIFVPSLALNTVYRIELQSVYHWAQPALCACVLRQRVI
jgi:hypothetical protein